MENMVVRENNPTSTIYNTTNLEDKQIKNKEALNKAVIHEIDDLEDLNYSNLEAKIMQKVYSRSKAKICTLVRRSCYEIMDESLQTKAKVVPKEFNLCRNLTRNNIFIIVNTIVQAFITMISVILYLIGTYVDDYDAFNLKAQYIELGIAFFIIFDYVVNFIKTEKKQRFVLKVLNIIDLVSIFCIFFSMTYLGMNLGFSRIVRLIRLVRILRIFKFFRGKKTLEENLKNHYYASLLKSILTMSSVIFISTGILHFLSENAFDLFLIAEKARNRVSCKYPEGNLTDIYNNTVDFFINTTFTELTSLCSNGTVAFYNEPTLSFDTIFYFLVTTLMTVGYGDLVPGRPWTRLLIGIFVIFIVLVISVESSKLNQLKSYRNAYDISYKVTNGPHIVITGFISTSIFLNFLTEFFHDDHADDIEKKIVLVQPCFPDLAMEEILNEFTEERLLYIKGDIFNEKILEKAKVKESTAVFMMSNPNLKDTEQNDLFLILSCKKIANYCKMPIFLQLHHTHSLLHNWADWTMAYSVQQLKFSIMVKNCFVQGFSTLIMNLIYSFNFNLSEELAQIPWIREYTYGLGQELYIVKLPLTFNSCKFSAFVEITHSDHSVLVIGVKKQLNFENDNNDLVLHKYLINPQDYTLYPDDELIVIASSKNEANDILNSKSKKYKNQDKNLNTTSKLTNLSSKNVAKDNVVKILSEKELDLYSSIKEHKVIMKKDQQERYNLPDIFKKQKFFRVWDITGNEFTSVLNNHIIIFCKEDILDEFLRVLDNYNNEIIFYVSDKHITDSFENIADYHENLIYLECSFSDLYELKKLNLERAKHIFILSWTIENSLDLDSGILPLIQRIEDNFEDCKFTIELCDQYNIRYLKKSKLNDLYNPFENLPIRYWPIFAKSEIFLPSSLDSILAMAYFNEGQIEILLKLLDINNLNKNYFREFTLENSRITTFEYRNDEKTTINYGKIFSYFVKLKESIIPMGIYRSSRLKDLKNEGPYIVTNPKKDTSVYSGDLIICLGESESMNFETYKTVRSNLIESLGSQKSSAFDENSKNFQLGDQEISEEDSLYEDEMPEVARKFVEQLYEYETHLRESAQLNIKKDKTNLSVRPRKFKSSIVIGTVAPQFIQEIPKKNHLAFETNQNQLNVLTLKNNLRERSANEETINNKSSNQPISLNEEDEEDIEEEDDDGVDSMSISRFNSSINSSLNNETYNILKKKNSKYLSGLGSMPR